MKVQDVAQYDHAIRRARREPISPDGARPGYAIEELLTGELVEGDGGACFVVPTVYGGDDRHGLHPFRDLAHVTGNHFALINRDQELTHLDLQRTVFLDTETTGLGMGAGTRVFLVGAGFFDGERFHVRQFFLREYNQERSFLAAIAQFLAGFSAIVTFNGKSFDWPLLEGRFTFYREYRTALLQNPLHVDLLHPARRLWKSRLMSCALSSLETHILRVERSQQDVPGYEIPSLYFRYIRTGDGRELQRVFYHNLHDVLSLASLAIHIDAMLREPLGGLVDHASDLFCLGKAYDRAGDAESATRCYDEALRRDLSRELRGECLMRLSTIQKRERQWDEALRTWERLIDLGGANTLFALVERAKYHEHVERDFILALDDVQQALSLSDLHATAWPETSRQELEHRLGRLIDRAFRDRGRGRARR